MEVMEERKKKRGENWSSEEKELLRQLIGSSANIIEDRCTNTTTNLKKGNEWKNIMIRFNELTGKSRSTEQLKLAWKRMKLSAKSNISSHMRALNTTGGGCKPPSPSPGDLQIMSIAPHDFLIEVNDYDSDAVVSNLAKATTSKEIYVDPKPGPDLENQTIVEEKNLLNEHNIIEVEKIHNSSNLEVGDGRTMSKKRKHYNVKNKSEDMRQTIVKTNTDFKKRHLETLEREHNYNIEIAELKIKKLMLQIKIIEKESDKY